MNRPCLNHNSYIETCNGCRLMSNLPGQDIEVHGFKVDEEGFWLLVSPDTLRIYKGMKMREVK